ncbi:hypothetical protein ABEB36_000929 [Hypothenemus hampei]|uniref:Uncharacterized protein n=1 Tax=Hypothenemus hampei TaxID=57062 RepID=A0ABD1FD00_HYPHA
MYKDIFVLNINIMEEEIRKIILLMAFKMELFLMIVGSLSVITIMLILFDFLIHDDRLLLQSFLGKGSILYHISRIAICCFTVPSVIPMIFIPTYFSYLMFHSQIYLLLLVDKIKKFKKKLSEEHLDSESIVENLKSFGQHHMLLKSFHYDVFEINHLYTTIYGLSGLIMGISILIAMFSNGRGLKWHKQVISFCKDEEDSSLKFLSSTLYDLHWYLWNVKCQKFYLLLMGQFSKVHKTPVLFVLHADMELFKRFARITYSTANCLLTLRQKKH